MQIMPVTKGPHTDIMFENKDIKFGSIVIKYDERNQLMTILISTIVKQ